ncbi:hypothetical protein [Haloarcula halophila]|uniref:hypothetical protein n=1 Tax=Haloarcula TaxID=2237 RepID=UPI0023E45DAF|nr:hypothetical protein [Halomicroarcula sp. DFY41]
MTDRPVAALQVGALALVLRLLTIPLSVLRINPYSQGDSRLFEAAAVSAAQAFASGEPPKLVSKLFTGSTIDAFRNVDQVWGVLLAPFWLVPGPSEIFARIVLAGVGAAAAYQVVVIGHRLHSQQAGVLAALPVAVFPTFVAIHATLLREGIILFALTGVVRLYVAPPENVRRSFDLVAIVGLLTVATVLRIENVPLYALAVGTGVAGSLYARDVEYADHVTLSAMVIGGIVSIWQRSRIVGFLRDIRKQRTRGRAVYLPDVLPDNIFQMVAFSWIAAAYFLFTPFPWMVVLPRDLVACVEAMITLVFGVASLDGVRTVARNATALTITLIVGLLAGATLYGLANANYGTAVRQRQMFVWVLFLFGAIGISNRIQFQHYF